jgi:hypothetical protein
MRKYILTDSRGNTAQGHKLTPGKFIQRDRKASDPLSKLTACCCETPLLAALASPIPAGAARLYQINCWNVSVDRRQADSYTVIKELTPVPAVTLDDKMRFTLTALHRTHPDRDFAQWAEAWLNGTGRRHADIEAVMRNLDKEQKVSDQLESLAAWGATGGDDSATLRQQDDLLHSAMHALHAALQMADGAAEEQVGRELAAALGDFSLLGDVHALTTLAEQIVDRGEDRQPAVAVP